MKYEQIVNFAEVNCQTHITEYFVARNAGRNITTHKTLKRLWSGNELGGQKQRLKKISTSYPPSNAQKVVAPTHARVYNNNDLRFEKNSQNLIRSIGYIT